MFIDCVVNIAKKQENILMKIAEYDLIDIIAFGIFILLNRF